MNTPNQDKGKSGSNLQKLFSSHVLENQTLKRQKSDLDNEKRKRLRELNNNEHLFLRKYEKYAVPRNKSRRGSIDAELARAIEVNYHTYNRPSSQIADRSFAKDSITDECPYSLETWNRLVDSEKSIIDENRQDILYGDEKDKAENEDYNSDKDTEMLLDEMFKTNLNLLESGKRLQRRQTLKPIEKIKNDYNEDSVDEEIVEIQLKQKKRGRRHSVALGALYGGQLNRDIGLKLPSIRESKDSFSKRKNSGSDPDFKSSIPQKHSSEENISFTGRKLTKNGRKFSLADNRTHLSLADFSDSIPNTEKSIQNLSLTDKVECIKPPVQDINESDSEEITSNLSKRKSISQINTPRPVANATVFVQEDSRTDKGSIFDTPVKTEDHETPKPKETGQTEESSFLPKILITKPDDISSSATPTSSRKHVSFEDIDGEMRDRSDSNSSKITTDSDSQPRGKRRRNSLATAALKLLVDSHHGAAKLRYIAKLATEMEKEELGKLAPEPEPDIYKEFQDCRYLRVVDRKGSAQSRDSEVI